MNTYINNIDQKKKKKRIPISLSFIYVSCFPAQGGFKFQPVTVLDYTRVYVVWFERSSYNGYVSKPQKLDVNFGV